MATATIVITDLPNGRIKAVSDCTPVPGQEPSPAQQAAQEIMRRTRAQYGLDAQLASARQNPMPNCPKCGNNRQVWANQITKVLTCHRAHCDTQIDSVAHHPV